MFQESIREQFETWYKQSGYDQISTWHEDKQRYTIFSTKQLAWDVWLASRGIDGGLKIKRSKGGNSYPRQASLFDELTVGESA